MDINTVRAVMQQQQAAQLDYYTGKKAGASSDSSQFAQILEQSQQKVWDPRWSEALENNSEFPLWGQLQATAVSYVQKFGESEATAVIGSIQSTSAINGTLSKAFNNSDFDALIEAAANKYGISADLIGAVIQTESNFNPNAVSSAGAKGLMQLMDGTARGLGVSNSFDPAQNIEGGTKYLAMLLKKYSGNVDVALAAYNAGPGRIDSLGITNQQQLVEKFGSLPKETQRYIGKVQSVMA